MAAVSASQSRASALHRSQAPHLESGASPGSPRTPTRTGTSAFSSPTVAGKSEDDPLIFSFGARYFRAGFARDRSPLCAVGYGPSEQQRPGDYRYWEPGYVNHHRRRKGAKSWTSAHELWPLDLRDANLGLIMDKIDRAVRQALNSYLLTDSKSRRALLILPPAFPQALLSVLLTTLFGGFQCPAITLLSGPVMAAVAAGVRSALVVDIGWHETVVTAVFEYREVGHRRSLRAGLRVLLEMRKFLKSELRKSPASRRTSSRGDSLDMDLSLEDVEDVSARFAWCRGSHDGQPGEGRDAQGTADASTHIQESGTTFNAFRHSGARKTVFLQSVVPPAKLNIAFSRFSDPVEAALFSSSNTGDDPPDDEETAVGMLAYIALLSLPPDVRSVCMSRIIVTGGCSSIPGVKRRVVQEVASIFGERGWDKVWRPAPSATRGAPSPASLSIGQPPASVQDGALAPYPSPGAAEPEVDSITEGLLRMEAKDSVPSVRGVVRGVESLGVWAGASLVAGLNIKGIVEIDRDRFLQQGLFGASREGRSSSGSGAPKAGAGDRSSWGLGIWT